jgi:pyrimidine operon attenuation protein / uracil phosphoribosyltransferase
MTTRSDIDIDATLGRMVEGLRPFMLRKPVMIGIHTGGVWVAERLHKLLGFTEPLGSLDISFYRDDFTRVGLNPEVKASHLPVNVDGRHVILVDDVLHTGRTIRAAFNEIFDYGRPASIVLAALIERDGRELPIEVLAALIERDGRELPIEAQVVGAHMKLAKNQHVKLLGPEPLSLKLQEVGA